MNISIKRCESCRNLLVLIGLSIFLYSCDTFHFARPLPVDKPNIYQFPKDFRGSWIDSEDRQFILISERNLSLYTKRTEKIVMGAWPKLNDSGDYVYPANSYNGFKTINYDSLRRPVDTLDNYLINGNYVYNISEEDQLEKGCTFYRVQDTLMLLGNDTIPIDLGQNAFLRKISRGLYVFNINSSILGKNSRWWQLVLFEKKDDHHINVWYCTSKMSDLAPMFYASGSDNYFDSNWTSEEILQLMKNGDFEIGTVLTRLD